MFTGLIEEVGTIARIERGADRARLRVECRAIMEGTRPGDSIAVDGCCLTAETVEAAAFTAYASPETMRRTSLGDRREGDPVNLERAMALGQRLGGHLVSGHVDATGTFADAREQSDAWELRFAAPPEIIRLCVAKGSIAIDGISLTVAEVAADSFTVWIIPETWRRTTLSRRRPGDRVNLESDLIGKYVFRFLETSGGAPAASDRRLAEMLAGWGSRG